VVILALEAKQVQFQIKKKIHESLRIEGVIVAEALAGNPCPANKMGQRDRDHQD
jgi:hypothetical protein